MQIRNGISYKDASLLGVEKNLIKYQQRLDKYYKNPKKCKKCKKDLPYKKRNNIFCSHSCSASFNNKNEARNTKTGKWSKKKCKNCKKETYNEFFCSKECMYLFKKNEKKQEIKQKNNLIDYKKNKWYLIETRGHICEVCNNSKWNKKEIPLDIHHKDGDSDNNYLDNLLLICPNCHRQTSTYGSKNKGNGRYSKRAKYRKNRYDKKLSY